MVQIGIGKGDLAPPRPSSCTSVPVVSGPLACRPPFGRSSATPSCMDGGPSLAATRKNSRRGSKEEKRGRTTTTAPTGSGRAIAPIATTCACGARSTWFVTLRVALVRGARGHRACAAACVSCVAQHSRHPFVVATAAFTAATRVAAAKEPNAPSTPCGGTVLAFTGPSPDAILNGVLAIRYRPVDRTDTVRADPGTDATYTACSVVCSPSFVSGSALVVARRRISGIGARPASLTARIYAPLVTTDAVCLRPSTEEAFKKVGTPSVTLGRVKRRSELDTHPLRQRTLEPGKRRMRATPTVAVPNTVGRKGNDFVSLDT